MISATITGVNLMYAAIPRVKPALLQTRGSELLTIHSKKKGEPFSYCRNRPFGVT